MRVRVVVNPYAGGGTAGRRTPELARELARAGLAAVIVPTTGPEHATQLAEQAFEDGVDCLMVVGGDGTVSEVCQAYLSRGEALRNLPRLALVPAGTGSDLGKTLGLSNSIEQAVANIVNGAVRPVDLGVVELTGHDGRRKLRAFANVTSFGLGGLTDCIVNRGPKWMGGRIAFLLGALRALLAYRNVPVALRVDGRDCLEAPVVNVALANGRYFGGGMQIAPEADPSDGLLDVVAVYDLTRAQGLALAHRIYRGTHLGCPGVRVARGRVVDAAPIRPSDEVLIDLDGETPGRLPLRASLLPGALRVCVPQPVRATSATAS
jgi:YegS/Rv2252/BmrU family lipid kinase